MDISLINVSHYYGKTQILKNISLSFERGKFSAIIGPNGCGKTTLFKLICRLLPLKHGEIEISGKSITKYTNKQLAQKLSALTQSNTTPEFMTVHDMVMQGRYCYQSFLSRYNKNDLDIVEKSMRIMHVEQYADRYTSQLSGGQLQRVRMAMLLAQETDFLLLDEPTSYLDLYHQYDLLDMIKDLKNSGKTIIATLHDIIHATLYADHISVLSDRCVYETGTPDEVISSSMVHEVFNIQTKNVSKTKTAIYIPEHLV